MNKNHMREEQNIITEFNIQTPPQKHMEYLEEYSTCCLCGSELEFTHVTNFITQSVQEQAHCSSCKIDHKSETHRLQ